MKLALTPVSAGRSAARWVVLVGLLMPLGVVVMPTPSSAFAGPDDPGWQRYQQRFVLAEGRIIDTANADVSHTEGQGWGMFLAVQFGDQGTFDRLWQWTEAHLARSDVDLFAWRYDPGTTPHVADDNNATDGDLFMAWALQLAADRWEDRRYAARSESIRESIRDHLIVNVGGYDVLLPGLQGFRHDGFADINLSYWVIPALRDFAARYPDEPWQAVIDSGHQLLERAQFGPKGLPADWLRLQRSGELTPALEWPTRFGFENVRTPLYFTWGGLRGVDTLEKIARFWDQPAPPAWIDVRSGETASYPLSQGGLAINALLSGRPWAIAKIPAAEENYYSATLLLLARVAASQLSLGAR
ncbi:glycosyl hydrolase family 8 [Salinicola aestuarinus]|uniref:glycosyl hydrolase family 8 n=1 Tax=Salinicola aestuarinus TaxID=1949082 RepID=UPI001300AE88|nr:glycosyl hydrolase family 8 [Salinicola aestuarinus]